MAGLEKHLDALTLEQLADGELCGKAQREAQLHLDGCPLCRTELAMLTALFTSLSALPRFAPSDVFADAVMARVQLKQGNSAVPAWLRGMLPNSRRGWMLVATAALAPAIPLLILLGWLVAQPLVTPAMLWQWAQVRTQAGAQAGLGWLLDRAVDLGVIAWAEGSVATVQSLPVLTIGGVVGTLAVAIPLSAWGLFYLTRTPLGRPTHAN